MIGSASGPSAKSSIVLGLALIGEESVLPKRKEKKS